MAHTNYANISFFGKKIADVSIWIKHNLLPHHLHFLEVPDLLSGKLIWVEIINSEGDKLAISCVYATQENSPERTFDNELLFATLHSFLATLLWPGYIAAHSQL